MPSIPHETILSLFEEQPEALLLLLKQSGLLKSIPPHTSVRVGKANFRRIVPSEVRADLVLVLYNGRKPVLALVIEVQLSRDAAKHFVWPRYLADVHDKYRCLTYLVVVALDAAVVSWVKQGIPTFHPPFAPLVIGPKDMPLIRTPAQAHKSLALSLLSVLAHGRGPHAAEVVRSAVDAAQTTKDAELRGLCYLVVKAVLTRSLSRSIEVKYMLNITKLIEMTRDDGIKESFRAGEKRGEERGEKRGAARGKAESLLTILQMRGVKLSATESGRITRCQDLTTLDRWIEQALRVTSAEELFAVPAAEKPAGKRSART